MEEGGTLTIKDSSGDNSGKITGGYDSCGGGICVHGTLNFEGGTISGCNGSEGGAIYIISSGTVNLTGGTITAKPSHYDAAGIGGGDGESGMQSVIIWDGDITAEGTEAGAGIGGGNANRGPSVTIYGGTVTAKGGSQAAGIGGGENRGNSTVKIYGGNVTANGNYGGAGIGGGYGGDVDNPIYIYGGTINATGGSGGAGIGGGKGSGGSGGNQNGDIYIYGGKITATGKEDGSGIGGGYDGNGGTIVINGGEVYAYGSTNAYAAAGIGGGGNGNGGNVTINGGKVKASSECWSSAIGISRNENKKAVINIASGIKVYSSHQGKTVNKDSRVSACEERGNFEVSVTIESCDHSGTTYTIKDANYHTIGNCSYCEMSGSDEAHTFGDYSECGVCYLVSLADDADNSSIISHWDNETKSVALCGRTFYKDGDWNTLCLPFDIDSEHGANFDFSGATVKELDVENKWSMVNGQWSIDNESGAYETGFDTSTGTLYLFFKNASTIEAGKPYLIKWESGEDLKDPVFSGVTITGISNVLAAPHSRRENTVQFVGNYAPVTLTANDKTKFYLGSDNQLYWPSTDVTLNAFRAYFCLNGNDNDNGNGVRAFSLHFGDDDATTGILSTTNLTNYTNSTGVWHDLSGRRISVPSVSSEASVLSKGVYIHNGKMVVIK